MLSKMKNNIPQLILNAIILILLFLMLYPLGTALWGAFKTDVSFDYSRWYPTLPLRINNIATAFSSVWRYIVNTVLVAVIGVTGSLFISSISAYTFARMSFPGKKFLYMAVISLMMVPGVLTLVPSFMLYHSMGLTNSYAVLIIPIIVGGPIFGVFLLRSFFESVPKDLFEAGQIDGAGDFKCYYLIALPLCVPILGTLTIMSIVDIWNNYLWPMITIQDSNLLTISAGLLISFQKQYSTNYPVTFAGYLVSSVPLILLFIFTNKYYIQGLISTSIKM